MNDTATLGIIGGSGLYDMPGLQDARDLSVDTPFGKTSAPIVAGTLEGTRVAFLARRESFEEMRLNPLMTRFLGPMPSQNLDMFSRVLYPMVVWVHQKHFLPNWEVEKIIAIPLSSLLDPRNYACCRVFFKTDPGAAIAQGYKDFPCFRHREEREEVLWGVTYRIVTLFLDLVFKFKVPEIASLPVDPQNPRCEIPLRISEREGMGAHPWTLQWQNQLEGYNSADRSALLTRSAVRKSGGQPGDSKTISIQRYWENSGDRSGSVSKDGLSERGSFVLCLKAVRDFSGV